MKRGLTILLFTTVSFAACPPEAVPGTCIEMPVSVQESVPSQSCGCSEKTGGDISEGIAAMARGDYQTAFAIFKSLAEAGNFIAQQNLGVMYNEGLGIAKDSEKASYWFEKSKAKSQAQNNGSLCTANRAQKGLSL